MAYCSDAFVPNLSHDFMMEDDYNGLTVTWVAHTSTLTVDSVIWGEDGLVSKPSIRTMSRQEALVEILGFLAADDFGFEVIS